MDLTAHLYYLRSAWLEAGSFLYIRRGTLVSGNSSVDCMLLETTACGRVTVGTLEGWRARWLKGWKARRPEVWKLRAGRLKSGGLEG